MPRRRCIIFVIICLATWSRTATAEEFLPGIGGGAAIDLMLERAVARRLIAGGVVVVGNREGIIYTTARGRLAAVPGTPPLDEHTIFDVASLTKPLATAPAVMKLLEEGKIALTDPLGRWFPEFRDSPSANVTILHLLTHTSGLDDSPLPVSHPLRTAILRAAAQRPWQRPGNRFSYADINFILLAELVQRVTGSRLDAYCREQIFGPLDLRDTLFLPPASLTGRIAPTIETIGGIVQDSNARRLGGVAGHAGLFSSAYDLARLARMFLNGGAVDGVRVLSEQTVALMTGPQAIGQGSVTRALGWDMDSPYSAPKGNFSPLSYGHTGYSGSSIWIDPQRDLFVIMLTIRLEYLDTRQFNQLRRDVSTLAGADFWMSGYMAGLRPEPPPLLVGRPIVVSPVRPKGADRKLHLRQGKAKQLAKITQRKRTRSARSVGKSPPARKG